MAVEFGNDDDLVDRIYEASVVPGHWSGVLKRLAEASGSREGVMVATNRDKLRWLVSSPEAEAFVQENYKFDGGMERTRRLLSKRARAFVTDRDLFTEKELAQLPVYRDYLIPSGYGRGVATAISLPDESRLIFHAEGDYQHGPYDARVISRLNGLRQHLARSAMISSRLAFERAQTAVELLAGLGYPACAVTDGGRVLVANEKFDETGDLWATRIRDRIVLADREADLALANAIEALPSGNGLTSIALRSSAGASPAVLHIVPIRRSAHDFFSHATAMLVLTTTSNEVTKETGLVQALFGLTPMEASVAVRIVAGHTLERIALTDAKSMETVRHQLKSVMSKTGCKRQVDLTRLLVSLTPPRI